MDPMDEVYPRDSMFMLHTYSVLYGTVMQIRGNKMVLLDMAIQCRRSF